MNRTAVTTDPDTAFRSEAPRVRLVNAFSSPFQNAIAAARTCYAQKGIVLAEDVAEKEHSAGADPSDAGSLPYGDMAKSMYQAGHHTVFQHAYFQFAMENVSRQFLWSFLHSHPFYNSEQVSQRYVRVARGSYAVPPMPDRAAERYVEAVDALTEDYVALRRALVPVVEAEFFRIFPGRRKVAGAYASTIKKRAQEVARYVLPVATFARLHHTVSALTIFRYYRTCRSPDTPFEQRAVAQQMVDAVLAVDPRYRVILEEPLGEDAFPESARPPAPEAERRAFASEFDAELEGRVSLLVDHKANAERIVADAVREVLGVTPLSLSDEDALALALDPGRNPLFGESLNVLPYSKLARCLSHASYTFRKKLSHSADSQNQRHRMTPGSRPILANHVTDEPDYVVPRLVQHDDAIRRRFRASMDRAWAAMRDVRRLGATPEHAHYLLPNALALRFTESGDLLHLHHKYAMRLCYNAQEEIWQASVDEVEQIRRVHPRLGAYLLPPCGLRDLARAKPVCPEGVRFCGITVWRLGLEAYERLL